jgi:hypothetical protein
MERAGVAYPRIARAFSMLILAFILPCPAANPSRPGSDPSRSPTEFPLDRIIVRENAIRAVALRLGVSPPIDSEWITENHRVSDGILLQILEDKAYDLSPSLRKFMNGAKKTDRLPIDTLGFISLNRKGYELTVQVGLASTEGYRILPAHKEQVITHLPEWNRSEHMAEGLMEFGILPTLRLGVGYPDLLFAQTGLAFTHFPKAGSQVAYVAGQAGILGFDGILGLTHLELGSNRTFMVLATYGFEYHQKWRDSQDWNAGPMVQFGFFQMGIQSSLWVCHGFGGEAVFFVQLFP